MQSRRVVAVYDEYQNVDGADVVPPQLAHFVLPADVRDLDPGPPDVQPVDNDPVRGEDGPKEEKSINIYIKLWLYIYAYNFKFCWKSYFKYINMRGMYKR